MTDGLSRGLLSLPPIDPEGDQAPPPIKSMDELITRKQFSQKFGISERTVDQWRYGKGGIAVPMPFFRFANKVYLWEGGIIWWFNQQRQRPDAYMIDRAKRIKEGKRIGGRT